MVFYVNFVNEVIIIVLFAYDSQLWYMHTSNTINCKYEQETREGVDEVGRSGWVGESVRLSIERSCVRIPPTLLQIFGKFVYPKLSKSLGMILVYPERMAVGVKPKDGSRSQTKWWQYESNQRMAVGVKPKDGSRSQTKGWQ